MSVWEIKHPDTINYHLSIIKDLKENGLTTGIANQNLRFGLQSNWFIITALFSFEFAPITGISYANTTIIIWFIIFLISLLQKMIIKQNALFFFSLLLLLFLMWLDYTQIRLTTTSTSTDFIVTMFVLVIFYVIHNNSGTDNYKLVPIVFSTFCLTLKISSLPLLFLICYQAFTINKLQTQLIALFSFLIIIFPSLVRNYFTSGHLLYPSAFPEFGKPEWAVSRFELNYLQDYITAYARTGSPEDISSVTTANEMPFQKWISIWWNLRNYGQKIILSCSALFIILFPVLAFIKRKKLANYKAIITVVTAIIGIFFWFYSAPDPRFGITWLYLLFAIFIYLIADNIYIRWNSIVANVTLYCFSGVLIIYIVYRLIFFFHLSNVIIPTH